MRYAKFIVAALAAALTVALPAMVDGHITGAEWAAIAGAALGALGVYAVPNSPTKDVAPPR